MSIYEIVNPSDQCTFEAPTDKVAVLAVLLLGRGHYGARREDGEPVGGFCLFGWDRRLTERYGLTEDNLAAEIRSDALAVATALESILLVGADDRAAIKAAGGDPRKFNDAKRTSLNDISGAAFKLAEQLRSTVSAEAGDQP